MAEYRRVVLCWLVLIIFWSALNPTRAACADGSDQDAFYLSVQLNDPFNADLIVRAPVKIGAPFQFTVENGSVKTTISGTVRESADDKYPLTIRVSEWASDTKNNTDTFDLRLELDKQSGYGPISSFVYLRTVTLSKKVR